MALTPNGTQAYVLTPANAPYVENVTSAVSVYDLPSGVLVRTIPLTGSPWQIYFSPDVKTAYVVASDGVAPPENNSFTLHLFAIDTATGEVTVDLQLPDLAGPDSVEEDAIAPDGRLLYVATATGGDPEIAVFSLPSLTMSGSFPAGSPGSGIYGISGMAVTPDGQSLIIATSAEINVYSTATNTLVGQAPAIFPSLLAVSPDGRSAYTLAAVTDYGFLDLEKLDLDSLTLTDSGVEINEINNLIMSPDGKVLLADTLFFDPVTLGVRVPDVNTLTTAPYGGFTPTSSDLWVLDSSSSEVVVIDSATNTVINTMAAPPSIGMTQAKGDSILISTLGLAIGSTEINQVVRSASPSGHGEGPVVAAGGNAYVNTGEEVTIYDLQTLVSSSLPLPIPLEGYVNVVLAIAASPDGNRFYASYYTEGGFGPSPPQSEIGEGQPCNTGGLLAYDTSTNSLAWCIGLNTNGAIAISPDSNTAYVDTFGSIATVDLKTQTVREISRFPDITFSDFSISSDGLTLYGKDGLNHTVAAIDLATMTVKKTYNIPEGANGMAITPDGSTLYLPNSTFPVLTAIATETGATTSIGLLSTSPGGIAVAPF